MPHNSLNQMFNKCDDSLNKCDKFLIAVMFDVRLQEGVLSC